MMIEPGHEAIKVDTGIHRISAQNAVGFNVGLEFIAGHTYTIHTYIYSNRQYNWVEDNTTNEVVYGKKIEASEK
ncbi:MAG: hypothetical protein H7A09_06890 [Oceanospirillaceae bacterium]|nr:hypothetical protein [Oceanospirillaceae bacterium]MCP5335777.1 hypothetical protein [Oceanospirillaceae bacterium]MCP5349929.1 hypothetical protein [Oceanospirillaceae bacterium]